MKSTLTINLVLVFTVLFILTGCNMETNNSSEVDVQLLESRQWKLNHFNQQPLIPNTSITISFSKGRVSGNAGANSYFASYTVEGQRLSVGPVASTKLFKMKPEGVMDQEQRFLNALAKMSRIQLNNDSLRLIDEGISLEFEVMPELSK